MVAIVLCVFFGLGAMTGFSAPGRALARRASGALSGYSGVFDRVRAPALAAFARLNRTFEPLCLRLGISSVRIVQHLRVHRGGAIAIVVRRDGFYALFASGALVGPISPSAQGDLPILSGPRVQAARGAELVGDATTMIRAEAELSQLVSEMSVGDDGVAALYLDRTRTEVRFDLDEAPLEIHRAAEVLRRWRGREAMVASLDMTTPGEAVLNIAAPEPPTRRAGSIRRISDRARKPRSATRRSP